MHNVLHFVCCFNSNKRLTLPINCIHCFHRSILNAKAEAYVCVYVYFISDTCVRLISIPRVRVQFCLFLFVPFILTLPFAHWMGLSTSVKIKLNVMHRKLNGRREKSEKKHNDNVSSNSFLWCSFNAHIIASWTNETNPVESLRLLMFSTWQKMFMANIDTRYK